MAHTRLQAYKHSANCKSSLLFPLHSCSLLGLFTAAGSAVEVGVQSIDVACAAFRSTRAACFNNLDCLQPLVRLLFPGVQVETSVSVRESESGSAPCVAFNFRAAAAAAPPPLNIGGVEGLRGLPAQRLAARAARFGDDDERGRFFRRILLWGLPVFHAKGHAIECRVVFEPSVCEGGGTRPESAEETFADVSRAASQARNMGQQHYDAFWSSMIVLLNGIRSEDLAFRVIQFVVKAWTALCAAEAKLASTLATAGLRAAPSAPGLLALEKARAARVQTAAAARKSAKSRKKVLATVRAATVAAGLAALNVVVAQLPAPPAGEALTIVLRAPEIRTLRCTLS